MSKEALAAIDFAIKTDDPVAFLKTWREGDWETIQKEWPEAPVGVIVMSPTKEKAPKKEPVAWYEGNWTMSDRGYREGRKDNPGAFANMKPAYPA